MVKHLVIEFQKFEWIPNNTTCYILWICIFWQSYDRATSIKHDHNTPDDEALASKHKINKENVTVI